MKTLIIVESPGKVAKIQEIVGKNYIVLASKGHITELAKGGNFGIGVNVNDNFKPKYILMEDKVNVLDNLIKASKEVDQIYIASDPDREGEAIAWHLHDRLKAIDKPIKRVVFNAITKDAIKKALKNNVRDIDIDLFHSQEVRRILDRIVGFTVSPFLMNTYSTNLSAGRVQSVVTRMIIDREGEIFDFKPEDYWTINVSLKNNKNESFSCKYDKKISDEKTAKDVTEKIQSATKYVVLDVIKEQERRYPPPPLVTSTMQRIMSKQHSFDPERTMKAAQSLYEAGIVTYIRTDSVRVEPEAIKAARDYLTNNNFKIPKKEYAYKNKNDSQDAHEAIRPSDLELHPDNNYVVADSDAKTLYDMIWRYFLASQMNPALFNTLKVIIAPENDKKCVLKATGKSLEDKGYLEMLGNYNDSQIDIPDLSKGDFLVLNSKNAVKCEKKQTQPPARFSEDKLIKELEVKCIGRPATYADILSKISNRNYVEKKGNTYYGTELGKKITDILVKFFPFMDYNYTAELEQKLDDIADKKEDYLSILHSFYNSFKEDLKKAYKSNGAKICDKCQSAMVIKKFKTSTDSFWACTGYPRCKNLIKK